MQPEGPGLIGAGVSLMSKRKEISKRTRFEIFKRDRFTCQYCGDSPPNVVLEVDHFIPVSEGGDNSLVNLVTSCQGCNAGKSNIDLDLVIPVVESELALGQEKLAQLKAMNRLVKASKREREKSLFFIKDVLEGGGISVSDRQERSMCIFLERLPLGEVEQAAYIATDRNKDFQYFCGVCWKKIRGGGCDE